MHITRFSLPPQGLGKPQAGFQRLLCADQIALLELRHTEVHPYLRLLLARADCDSETDRPCRVFGGDIKHAEDPVSLTEQVVGLCLALSVSCHSQQRKRGL
ncbi:hypothetical protein GCM10008957_52200 [Deinococcus ruber]|uniref:Uncharacterized protein n=1 Tax=Deinococcus ruber TaxID=1848197 RepID=A0A918KVK2_9DEIO|nr:hypothetical protein GCM10008957_52200 [Deinococcus ruber]